MKEQIQAWYHKVRVYCLFSPQPFAQGLSFPKLVFLFVIGCVVGVYYEQLLTLFNHYMADGSIVWESRRGVIYGPFNPLYGAGVVTMTICLARKQHPWYIILLYGALLGGIIEYGVSYLQEFFVGTTSWDYTGYFLEIGGRTTIPFMLVWGMGGCILTFVIYPFLSNLIEKIPYNLGMIITKVLVIFLVFDMLISWTAIYRQTQRRAGRPPYTVIGKIYDEVYTDAYLKHYFPNMRPVRNK